MFCKLNAMKFHENNIKNTYAILFFMLLHTKCRVKEKKNTTSDNPVFSILLIDTYTLPYSFNSPQYRFKS